MSSYKFAVGDPVQVRDRRDGQLAIEKATYLGPMGTDGYSRVRLPDGNSIGVPTRCVEPRPLTEIFPRSTNDK